MITRTPSFSEIISWLALGFAFPISANFFLIVRATFLPAMEEILNGRPLPPITVFFAAFPSQTAMIAAVVGVAVCVGGIYLRRFEFFHRHQVFFISTGWVTAFFFLGASMMAMVMPFISIVNGIGMQP